MSFYSNPDTFDYNSHEGYKKSPGRPWILFQLLVIAWDKAVTVALFPIRLTCSFFRAIGVLSGKDLQDEYNQFHNN